VPGLSSTIASILPWRPVHQACTCEEIRSRQAAFARSRPPAFSSAGQCTEAGGGCDYLLFGTVFPSTSKLPTDPISGPEALREVCATAGIPVLAIGGISIENVSQVAASGAAGIAAISLFQRGDSIAATVSTLRRPFDT
jgi:thiamine monophosphate synthase